jgi:flagellar motor switch protein FliG
MQIRALFAALSVAVAITSATAPSVAAAQAKSENKDAAISREALAVLQPKLRARLDTLEERARKIVGQQLTDGRFLLYIKGELSAQKFLTLVKSKGGNTQLTTLPVSLSAGEKQKLVAENLSADDVALIAGPITVTITFDTDIPNGQATALKEAVGEALEISARDGDAIVIKKAPITAPSTTTKLEMLNTKISEGNKDLEKLRYEMNLAQQKLSQVEAERLKLQDDLKDAQEKNKRMQEDLSIYKTPLGDIKKLIKGLELPLTILPIAFLLFVFVAIGFFLYLRFQGTKTTKLMQAADIMAQAFAKAGRTSGSAGSLTLDAARAEMTKLIANQNDDAARIAGGAIPQALLSEEVASAKQESLDAWNDLKKYPYLTLTELREWLVGGGPQTQRFIALTNALGPVESMRLLQQFSHEDLALMKGSSVESASKLPGYAAILQLHRSVSSEVIRKPQCVAELNFPELIRASDAALAQALETSTPLTVALCINLLSPSKRARVMDTLSAETQARCVEGMDSLVGLGAQELQQEIAFLKNDLSGKLTNVAAPRLGAEDAMALLLSETSAKTRAVLNETLSKHDRLKNTLLEKMVTFDDVLELEDETLSELLDDMEPEQIATLVSGLQKTAQNRVAKVLPRKIIVAIQNELQRLGTRQALMRRAQTQSLELQAALAERLKTLVEEGVVDLKRRGRAVAEEGETGALNATSTQEAQALQGSADGVASAEGAENTEETA